MGWIDRLARLLLKIDKAITPAPPEPEWSDEGATGPLASFTYCDSKNKVSERMVRNWRSDGTHIKGFCVHRKAVRSFQIDRITDWVELE